MILIVAYAFCQPTPGPVGQALDSAPRAALAPLAQPPLCVVTGDCSQRILIKFRSSTVSVGENGTDYNTLPPPDLPGLVLLSEAPFLGIRVYAIVGNANNPTVVCTRLQSQYSQIQYCDLNASIKLHQQLAPVPNPPPLAAPNDSLFPSQYSLSAIGIPDVWKTGNFGDKRVRVGIIDSGEFSLHPAWSFVCCLQEIIAPTQIVKTVIKCVPVYVIDTGHALRCSTMKASTDNLMDKVRFVPNA